MARTRSAAAKARASRGIMPGRSRAAGRGPRARGAAESPPDRLEQAPGLGHRRLGGGRAGGGERPLEARPRRLRLAEGVLGGAEVVEHQRLLRQPRRGALEVRQRRLAVAALQQDPAVGVLEMRLVGAAQPPGDGIGPLLARGVAAVAGQEARQVVGDELRAGVPGVEVLVDRDRRLEVAGDLELARLDEQEPRVPAGGGEAGLERRGGGLGLPGRRPAAGRAPGRPGRSPARRR